jgi:hypothetical protein
MAPVMPLHVPGREVAAPAGAMVPGDGPGSPPIRRFEVGPYAGRPFTPSSAPPASLAIGHRGDVRRVLGEPGWRGDQRPRATPGRDTTAMVSSSSFRIKVRRRSEAKLVGSSAWPARLRNFVEMRAGCTVGETGGAACDTIIVMLLHGASGRSVAPRKDRCNPGSRPDNNPGNFPRSRRSARRGLPAPRCDRWCAGHHAGVERVWCAAHRGRWRPMKSSPSSRSRTPSAGTSGLSSRPLLPKAPRRQRLERPATGLGIGDPPRPVGPGPGAPGIARGRPGSGGAGEPGPGGGLRDRAVHQAELARAVVEQKLIRSEVAEAVNARRPAPQARPEPVTIDLGEAVVTVNRKSARDERRPTSPEGPQRTPGSRPAGCRRRPPGLPNRSDQSGDRGRASSGRGRPVPIATTTPARAGNIAGVIIQ